MTSEGPAPLTNVTEHRWVRKRVVVGMPQPVIHKHSPREAQQLCDLLHQNCRQGQGNRDSRGPRRSAFVQLLTACTGLNERVQACCHWQPLWHKSQTLCLTHGRINATSGPGGHQDLAAATAVGWGAVPHYLLQLLASDGLRL